MAEWGMKSNIPLALLAFKKIEDGIKKDAARAIYNVGAFILRTAMSKGYAPVGESGHLRGSGRLESKQSAGKKFTTVTVSFGGKGLGVDYAIFQELGTSKMAGKFYLLRATKKHKDKLIKLTLNATRQVWDREAKKFNIVKLTR